MEDLKALVLAAGKSTRLHPVSGGLPKPLIRIAGESILSRTLRWLAFHGISTVWVNLHYKPEEIRAAIGDGSRFGLAVRYIWEPEILGTAGAVRNLASEWVSTFLVVYGDNLVCFDLRTFHRFHLEKQATASVALFDRRTHSHTGVAGGRVELGPDSRIIAFHEGTNGATPPLVNAGAYLLEPEVVGDIPADQFYDFGRDLFPRMLGAGRAVYGYIIRGYCLGIDTPESYDEAIRLVESGEVELP